MNILQIGTTDKRGGAALVSYYLKKKLEELGHNTSMFIKEKYSDNTNVFVLGRSGRWLNKLEDILHFHLANDFEFFRSDYLLGTKEFKNADIIHCHNLHGGFFNLKLLEKISKIKPLVWTLHDMWPITGHCAHSFDCQKWQTGCHECPYLKNPPGLKWDNTRPLWQKKQEIYQKSKLNLVVPSKWLMKKIKKSILKDQNIVLIYNGVDYHIFKPDEKGETRRKLGIPLNKKVILLVFPGDKRDVYKGWSDAEKIINGYQDHKNILFLCLGGGESEGFNHNNVKYIKYINNESVLGKYYSAADIFLFTSRAENFPLVILEALSCGLPIVSFDVGGVSEAVLHKKNGYLAKCENLEDLKRCIDYLISLGDNQIEKISANSLKRIKEKFSLKMMVDKYLKLYQQILEKKIILC